MENLLQSKYGLDGTLDELEFKACELEAEATTLRHEYNRAPVTKTGRGASELRLSQSDLGLGEYCSIMNTRR